MFAALLAVTFAAWFASERTLSIHSIVTRRREAFYWLAILFTFALGTSAGDLFDEQLGVGYWPTVALVAVIIALVPPPTGCLGLNAVLAFWVAYILTRPLGASIGDGMSQAHADGGLGLGTTGTSVIFLAVILALVVFLAVTKIDQTERVEQLDELVAGRAPLVRVPAEQAYGDQRHHRREPEQDRDRLHRRTGPLAAHHHVEHPVVEVPQREQSARPPGATRGDPSRGKNDPDRNAIGRTRKFARLTAPSCGLGERPGEQPQRHERQRAGDQQRERHPPGPGQPQPEGRHPEPDEDRHLHQRDHRSSTTTRAATTDPAGDRRELEPPQQLAVAPALQRGGGAERRAHRDRPAEQTGRHELDGLQRLVLDRLARASV